MTKCYKACRAVIDDYIILFQRIHGSRKFQCCSVHRATPKLSPYQGSQASSNTRLFRPTRVYPPIGISIGSAICAGLTNVTSKQTDRQTDTQTDHSTPSSAGLAMWQEWQMPRASGLRGASGNRKNVRALNIQRCCPRGHACKNRL